MRQRIASYTLVARRLGIALDRVARALMPLLVPNAEMLLAVYGARQVTESAGLGPPGRLATLVVVGRVTYAGGGFLLHLSAFRSLFADMRSLLMPSFERGARSPTP